MTYWKRAFRIRDKQPSLFYRWKQIRPSDFCRKWEKSNSIASFENSKVHVFQITTNLITIRKDDSENVDALKYQIIRSIVDDSD